MAPALLFNGLTLGYDQLPAVQNLHTEVAERVDRHRRPQRRRQVDLAERCHGLPETAGGQARFWRLGSRRCGLSPAAVGDRPILPAVGCRPCRYGTLAGDRTIRMAGSSAPGADRRRDCGGRTDRSRRATHRNTFRRAVAAGVVRAAFCCKMRGSCCWTSLSPRLTRGPCRTFWA